MKDDKNIRFVVTEHAKKRLKQRFNCKEEKMVKITGKAWRSKDVINDKLIKKLVDKQLYKYENTRMVFRYFYGYIFLFDDETDHKKLVTIYHPNSFTYESNTKPGNNEISL